jgi:hypothetical protein
VGLALLVGDEAEELLVVGVDERELVTRLGAGDRGDLDARADVERSRDRLLVGVDRGAVRLRRGVVRSLRVGAAVVVRAPGGQEEQRGERADGATSAGGRCGSAPDRPGQYRFGTVGPRIWARLRRWPTPSPTRSCCGRPSAGSCAGACRT